MFELLQLARDCIEVEESPGHKLTNLETTGAPRRLYHSVGTSVPIRTLDTTSKVSRLSTEQSAS